MTVNIRFRTDPQLTHINLRKQGEEGMEEIAVDLKICGLAEIGPSGELLQNLLGCDARAALSFWMRPDVTEGALDPAADGPEIAHTGITCINTWACFKDKHVAQIAGIDFRPDKVSKFKITPRPGYLIDLEMQVSIAPIENRELQILTEHLREEIPFELIADPDLFTESKEA